MEFTCSTLFMSCQCSTPNGRSLHVREFFSSTLLVFTCRKDSLRCSQSYGNQQAYHCTFLSATRRGNRFVVLVQSQLKVESSNLTEVRGFYRTRKRPQLRVLILDVMLSRGLCRAHVGYYLLVNESFPQGKM